MMSTAILMADNAVSAYMNSNIERIADHAENICEWIRFSQTGEHKNTKIF